MGFIVLLISLAIVGWLTVAYFQPSGGAGVDAPNEITKEAGIKIQSRNPHALVESVENRLEKATEKMQERENRWDQALPE